MENTSPIAFSDCELLVETARVAATERDTTAKLIALLAEVDGRRLHLGEGYSSLFRYCTEALRLSEHAAYERITAARLSRRLPVVLARLTEGTVTLTAVGLLAPHLSDDNCERLLEAARHKSKRDVERLVASIDPQPDVPASIRRLPDTTPPSARPMAPRAESATEALVLPLPAARMAAAMLSVSTPRARVSPIASDRYVLKVTVSAGTHAKLYRAQALLRHAIPNGDPAEILDRALTLLVDQLEKTRMPATPPRARRRMSSRDSKAAPSSRYVPADIKREVWTRDAGRCAFVGARGRCAETSFLELHHVVPFATGGATTADNLALRCRAHNAHEAALFFGEAAFTRTRSGPSSAVKRVVPSRCHDGTTP